MARARARARADGATVSDCAREGRSAEQKKNERENNRETLWHVDQRVSSSRPDHAPSNHASLYSRRAVQTRGGRQSMVDARDHRGPASFIKPVLTGLIPFISLR